MKIDLSKVKEEDLERVKELLGDVHKAKKYSSRLSEFWDMAYDWQRDAIKFTGDHSVVGILASNQTGKTETICAIVAAHATGIYPDWWEGRKFEHAPTIALAGVDANHNRLVLQDKLFGTTNRNLTTDVGTGTLPLDFIVPDSVINNRDGAIGGCHVKHISGKQSQILFKSYSQGRQAIQGFPADLIAIDEAPPDEEFWDEARIRTSARDGLIMCAFTPLLGLTPLVETFWMLPELEDAPEDDYGKKRKSNGNWAMVRSTWQDAPHIKNQEEQIDGMPRHVVATRTMGIPLAGAGRVFEESIENITYDPKNLVVRDEWLHIIGIDIGHGSGRDPSAIMLIAKDESTGMYYLTDEWVGQVESTRELAKRIRGIATGDVNVAWPRDLNATTLSAGSTVFEQLRNVLGINLLSKPFLNPPGADNKQNNYKMPGIKFIQDLIAERKLLISEDCAHFIKEYNNYSYTKTGKLQDGRDDAIDAFRYGIMSIDRYGDTIIGDNYDWGEPEEYFHQSY